MDVLTIPETVTPEDIRRLDILIGKGCSLSQLATQETITERSARQWARRVCAKFGLRQRPQGRPLTPLRTDPIQAIRDRLAPLWQPSHN